MRLRYYRSDSLLCPADKKSAAPCQMLSYRLDNALLIKNVPARLMQAGTYEINQF